MDKESFEKKLAGKRDLGIPAEEAISILNKVYNLCDDLKLDKKFGDGPTDASFCPDFSYNNNKEKYKSLFRVWPTRESMNLELKRLYKVPPFIDQNNKVNMLVKHIKEIGKKGADILTNIGNSLSPDILTTCHNRVEILNNITIDTVFKKDPRMCWPLLKNEEFFQKIEQTLKYVIGEIDPTRIDQEKEKHIAMMVERKESINDKEEIELNNLYDYFRSKNFFFSKEILTRYFLSLKTKPFVILTGISGTGKTKIAQVFAEYMCQDDSSDISSEMVTNNRKVFVSVHPDWMDNKGLLGYYNLIEEKYHATPLLRLLLEAVRNSGKPYFVILDEMNLAKVEHYFSDFLSIMESRTPDNPAGEPVILHNWEHLETKDGLQIPGKLHIPSNVYFTGTVNVDESTYMFSPKVLDRANVIEFNDVKLEEYKYASSMAVDSFILKNPDVRDGLQCHEFCSRQDYLSFLKNSLSDQPLSNLLNILEHYHLHFGYRVINEISRFVTNTYTMVDRFEIDTALDIQFLQKVLPKFHGTQAKLQAPLEMILCFCYDLENGDLEELKRKANEFDLNARFPRTAQKTARMIHQLEIQGYTSFIE